MNRFLTWVLLLVVTTTAALAQSVDVRNPVFNYPNAGVVVGAPTGGNLGGGTVNATGVYVNGQAVGGGLSVPNSCVIGGTGTALSAVTLGSNLSCTSGTLNATPSGGSGNVSNSGTPTSGQIAVWTSATQVQGESPTGAGSPVLATSPTIAAPTLTGTTTSAGITDSGGINETAASPYSVNGSPVINLLANQSNPIKSPETQNAPLASSIYLPAALVQGYAATLNAGTASTYESMYTSNLTASGTATNHYGFKEETLNLIGSGTSPTVNGELNVVKSLANIGATAGVAVATGENYESEVLVQSGSNVSQWSGYQAFPEVLSGGTLGTYTGFNYVPTNNNTTAGSYGASGAVGFKCSALSGGGAAVPTGYNTCILNLDPTSTIRNYGHYESRHTTAPTVGTGCSIDGNSSDEAGTVTWTSAQTQCVVTFNVPYESTVGMHAVITSDNGSFLTSYALGTTTLTLNTLSVTGSHFTYRISGY